MKKLLTKFVFAAFSTWLMSCAASAHDFKIGDLTVDHPYATPTVSAQSTGAVYFRSLRNPGSTSDRLISAQTPASARVGLHRMRLEGEVMRMREVAAIELPPTSELRMGHASTDGYHLMLEGLKAPLRDGDSFPLTLRFEKAGEKTVQVHVQTPRQRTSHEHKH